ncbi:MAG TPA: O-antigen ligase family protein, partial [Chitinophagaceae bacterium]|nr:O-antigen ligase family protein [Chitinophagaceae bacterium]
LGIAIAGSLVFWPLATGFFSILLFVYWAIFAKKDFNKQRLPWVLLFASLFILVIIGSFYSANTNEAMFRLQQKSALALYPLVFGTAAAFTAVAYHRILVLFAWFTLAGCMFCLGFGTMNLIQTGSAEMMYGYQMVVLKDMSPFILGLYCLLSVIYLLTAIYKGAFAYGRQRTTYVVVLLFLSLFLFVLGNRNVLFSWSLVIIFFYLRRMTKGPLRIISVAMMAAVFVAAVAFNPSLKQQVHDLTDFSKSNTIQLDADKSLGRNWGGKALRVAIWQCSLDIIKVHWLTGVGTGDVQDSLQAAYERRKFYFASRYNSYNAHNQFVQETLAYGIVGFVLFAACLLLPLFRYPASPERQLYILFLLSFFIICLTESILEISKGIVFYSLFNSIFAFVRPQMITTQKKEH